MQGFFLGTSFSSAVLSIAPSLAAYKSMHVACLGRTRVHPYRVPGRMAQMRVGADQTSLPKAGDLRCIRM